MLDELLKKYTKAPAHTVGSYKYLYITDACESRDSGLLDLVSQFRVYISVAYKLGLELVLPNFILAAKHNRGREVPLAWYAYYNVAGIKVNGELYALCRNPKQCYGGSLLCMKRFYCSDMYGDYAKEITRGLRIDIPFSKTTLTSARQLTDHNINCVIHVRRGDRVSKHGYKRAHFSPLPGVDITPEQWGSAHSKDNILSTLNSMDVSGNVYVMTDMLLSGPEADPVAADLKSSTDYNFLFYSDFPDLEKVKEENNYKLFNIEECLAGLVPSYISKEKVVKHYMGW